VGVHLGEDAIGDLTWYPGLYGLSYCTRQREKPVASSTTLAGTATPSSQMRREEAS